MLLIKAKIKPSPLHGIGLFAEEKIKKGTKIWRFSKGLDTQITPTAFEKLSDYERNFILFHGFFSKKTRQYHLSFDNIRFMNHSDKGNVTIDRKSRDIEYSLIAKKDIKNGAELTQNYFEFDDDHTL